MDSMNEERSPVGTGTPVVNADAATEEKRDATRPFPQVQKRAKALAKPRAVLLLNVDRVVAAQISRRRDKVRIEQIAAAPIDNSKALAGGGEIVAAIDMALQAFGERPKVAEVVLPEEVVKKTVVSLPAVTDAKAKKILRNRALQVSGIADEDLVWRARPLGTVERGGKPIGQWVIFTASRPSLVRYVDAIRNARIRVTGLYPATSMLLNTSRGADLQQADAEPDVIGEVILADECILFNILAGGSTAFTRSIRFDPELESSERLEILSGELQRSFLYCEQNLKDTSPSRVEVLHAGAEGSEELFCTIESSTEVDTCGVDVRGWLELAPGVDETTVPRESLLTLLGVGLQNPSTHGKGSTDLLPRDLRPRNWGVSAKIATTLALIEIGLLIYRLSSSLDRTIEEKSEVLAEQRASRQSLVPVLDALHEVEKRDTFLQLLETTAEQVVPVRYDWLSFFKDLAVLPEGDLFFQEVTLDPSVSEEFVNGRGTLPTVEWTVQIDVASPLPYRAAQELVQEYVGILRRSKYLRSVNVRPIQKGDPVPEGVPPLSHFSVDCVMN